MLHDYGNTWMSAANATPTSQPDSPPQTPSSSSTFHSGAAHCERCAAHGKPASIRVDFPLPPKKLAHHHPYHRDARQTRTRAHPAQSQRSAPIPRLRQQLSDDAHSNADHAAWTHYRQLLSPASPRSIMFGDAPMLPPIHVFCGDFTGPSGNQVGGSVDEFRYDAADVDAHLRIVIVTLRRWATTRLSSCSQRAAHEPPPSLNLAT